MLLGMDAKASPFCALPERKDEMKKRTWEKSRMELFRELNGEGRTIIMITHDLKIARHATRIVNILDGVLSEGVSVYD